MTTRLARLAAPALLALLAAPALAQAPDFGDDSSTWANDGECDDPRFTGPGVAAVTVAEDEGRDATDCRAAFDAGTAQLAAGAAAPVTPVAPTTPGKGGQAPAATAATPAAAGPVDLGDDSGDYPRDGECDDRRFVGAGMASVLSWGSVGGDASDCRPMLDAGRIRLWDPVAAQAASLCAAIDFGDDSGQYANDGECDDIRFEGLGSASVLSSDNTGKDAADCSRLCAFGAVALRDY